MTRFYLALLLLPSLLATTGQAQLYGQLGASYLFSSDYDNEFNWDGVIGYAWGSHALEVQSGIYGFDDEREGFEAEFELLPILINYAYAFDSESRVQWEAGLGAGVAISEFDLSAEETGEDAIFLGQVFGRALFPLSDHLSGVLEYRGMYSGQADEGEANVDAQFIHGPSLSLRLSF